MCAPFHPESGRYARIRGAQTFSPHLFSLFSGNVPAGISATAECVRPNRSSIDSNPEHILAEKSCVCTQSVNVGVYAFKSPRFGEIATANWSRFESYKLSRLPARIRAAPPPSVNTRTARGDWKKGGDGVCVRDWLFGSRQGKILPPNSVCVYCWRIFSPHNLFWRRYCRLRPLSLASIQILGQKYVEDISPPLWILIYRRTFEKNIFYFRRWNLSRRI